LHGAPIDFPPLGIRSSDGTRRHAEVARLLPTGEKLVSATRHRCGTDRLLFPKTSCHLQCRQRIVLRAFGGAQSRRPPHLSSACPDQAILRLVLGRLPRLVI